ncbi:MFS transporter [Halovulum dunhuangense]|uniref:MFS transporter n=2 Tax=Halovulum dunhuangense TaxID=1505036 RepID=A0A849L3X5_9RHOB|nr:MFS transporter [Halovulum dunhuangense]
MWAIIITLPAVQADFGIDRGGASLPYVATMLGFALGNLVLGRAVDRFGIVPVLIGAALSLGAGFALSALAPSVVVLSLLQFAVGLGTAASFGPLIADISHWFLRRRGIAVSIAASGNYLSGAIWPVVLSPLLASQGWRAVFLALAGIAVAGMIPLALMLKRRLPEGASVAADTAAALARSASGLSPRALSGLLAIAGIGCCVAMSMPQVHIVAYCVDLGYGPAVGAEMLSLMLLGGVASRIVSGLIADRLGGVRTLLLGSVLQMLALFFYLPFDGLVSLYVVSLVFGLAQGGIVPAYAIIVREYLPAREAGARVGFVIMATLIGMALGGWMSGWIYDVTGSYHLAFINGIVWNAANIVIMLAILARGRAGAAPLPA